MRGVMAVLLLSALLAGCSDTTEDAATDSVTATDQDPSLDDGDQQVPPGTPWEELVVPVSFNGNLGMAAYGCDYNSDPDGSCLNSRDYLPLPGGNTDILHEAPGAIWTGVDLTLAWDSPSPVTDSLVLGIMRMGTNSTSVANQDATSPNTFQDTELDLPLDEDNLIHVYIYNANGFHSGPNGFTYASPDQSFTVEGTITLLVPADAAP